MKVRRFVGHDKNHFASWECECTCGDVRVYSANALRSCNSKSCGCARTDSTRKHGMWDTPEYRTWTRIKTRCFNEKAKTYKYYGARGITMCERWRSSFETFFADMGPRPRGDARQWTIERKDNDGNYEPSNCKWANQKEQAGNKRYRRGPLYEYEGRQLQLTKWAEEAPVSYLGLYKRLKRGWSMHEAMTIPSGMMRPEVMS